jgi:sulfite reductase (NADPH) hemoprotein beta-component
VPHYGIVTVSLKPIGGTPGDATAEQMRVLADLAETFGHDELRVSHEQNIILPHVPRRHLPEVYRRLKAAGLATANVGLVSDIIACPGMDYCALATARSIPVAQGIAEAFADLDRQRDIGPLKIKISGCINACGHHHVGHIGILGLDRAGVENYQITLGGDGTETAAIGERAGPGFAYDEIVPAVERLIEAYLDLRSEPGETFLAAYRRLGPAPFKAALYPGEERSDAA